MDAYPYMDNTRYLPEVYVHNKQEAQLNSCTCMVISLNIQTSVGKNGHSDFAAVGTNY